MKLYYNIARNNNIESRHKVYAVAINDTEKLNFSIGDPNYITCVRSALKPFQAPAAIYLREAQQANFSQKQYHLCVFLIMEKIYIELAQSMEKNCF